LRCNHLVPIRFKDHQAMAAVDTLEREKLRQYMKKHSIEDMIQKLVEGLLQEKPDAKPQEHWAQMLRLQKRKKKDKDVKEAAITAEVPARLLSKLFEGTKQITAEIVPSETIKIIIRETAKLLNCDRVSLFIYDKRLDLLKLNASNLEAPIRVKPGQGIAGHVFTKRETINIPDCYADDRFDQTFDKMTGYKTKHLLTMPIIDFEGECLGVLQAINKLEDELNSETHFTHVDDILMENLTQHVSVALRNAELYRAAIVTSERSNALVSMMQSLSQDLGSQSTILTITMHASQLVQADRCTVFLVDEGKQQLCSVSTDSGREIRIPRSAGIAGECATEAKLIVIDDCYADSRFNQAIDKQTGYKTTSMLALPIVRRKARANCGKVIAVIQMINKMEFDGEVGKFDEEDIQIMETCATYVCTKLEGSELIERISQIKDATQEATEGSIAFNHTASTQSSSRHKRGSLDCAPIEDEEDEEGS